MKQSSSILGPPTLLMVLFVTTAASTAVAAPELPRSYVNTDYVAPTGRTIAVASGGNFQSALEAAAPGDVITLAAGATYTGNFTLPFKGGSGWILVRTSAPDASLPAAGTRVTAAHAAVMPKIVSNNASPALSTTPGAHHYRFLGVEFTVASSVGSSYGVVSLGDGGPQTSLSDVPHHLIFDRVYVHGTSTANVRRGFAFNSSWTALIDSRVSEIHELGADSQAVGGWNGPGPFKIVNNYLEAAAENVLFGGADPSIPNLVPSDIEVRGNHLYKPTRWKIGASNYAGKAWVVKNLFELKNARRALIEGNVFENNWAHGQNGFAVLFTVRNQDGSAPWSTVEDVTFVKNVVRHTGSAVNVLGRDNNYPSGRAQRIAIRDNCFEDVDATRWGGSGRLFQLLSGPGDVVVDHNTGIHSGEIIVASGEASTGFVYRNNLTPHNAYGIGGDGTFGNGMLTLSTFFPGAVFTKNVLAGGSSGNYPSGNYFPSNMAQVGFVSLSAGDYRLGSSSPYRNAGTDGKDLGADVAAVSTAATAAVQGTSSGTPPPPPPPPPTPDVTPPVISGLSVGSITSTGATVSWQTNEPANSAVEYGLTTVYGSQKSVTTLVTNRSITLTGLSPSTTYHARAVSKDAAGNTAKSADFVVVTTAASGTGGAPQSVSWTALVNVSASGGTLTKTGGCDGCQDAGAVSTQQIASGDGYVELTVPATGTQRAIGLSRGNSNTRLDDIDYAWRFWPDGGASVLENGLYRSVSTTYKPGDVFRIAVASQVVRYYKNGALVYSSLLAPLYPLLVDTSFLNLGASLQKVVIATSAGPANATNVTWKGLVNASASGDALTKTAGCNGCQDAGAVSLQRIRSGSGGGAVELTVSETGTDRVIGLSRGNSSTRIDDIDYALRFWPDGGVDVREKGRYRNVSSTYLPGDVFRIAVAARKVSYYKNDTLLYTSRAAPRFPLLVDTSLLDSAAAFSNVVMLH